jgi:hypothetical protein
MQQEIIIQLHTFITITVLTDTLRILYTHIYIYIYIYTHTHTHTHTQQDAYNKDLEHSFPNGDPQTENKGLQTSPLQYKKFAIIKVCDILVVYNYFSYIRNVIFVSKYEQYNNISLYCLCLACTCYYP